MVRRLKTPLAIWALLIAATLLSYASWLDARYADPRVLGSLVVLLGLFKAWLIGQRFMELDEAILPLRILFACWIGLVGTILLILFWLAP